VCPPSTTWPSAVREVGYPAINTAEICKEGRGEVCAVIEDVLDKFRVMERRLTGGWSKYVYPELWRGL